MSVSGSRLLLLYQYIFFIAVQVEHTLISVIIYLKVPYLYTPGPDIDYVPALCTWIIGTG